VLMVLRVNAAVFIGMIVTAVAGMAFGLIDTPKAVVSSVPSLDPTFGAGFQNIGDIFTVKMLVVILTFLFVDFFDTAGTMVAVASQAG
ncbi:NCS2 family permease, partial [Bacillus pseudomycoides]|nr:NCS2 family permease [Bacillus pseudomycoides]